MVEIVQLPREEEFTEEKKRLDLRGRQYTGAPAATPYVRALSYRETFFANVTESWNYIMHDRNLPRKTKEIIALSVSMNNSCEYCIIAHSRILRRLFKLDDGGLAEIAATVAHVAGLNSLDHAAAVLPEIAPAYEANQILGEIMNEYGYIPTYFKVISNDLGYLKLVWDREKFTFGEGSLERKAKLLAALAVSITNGSNECAKTYSSLLRRETVSESEIVEAIWVCENFNMNNRYTSGLRLSPGLWGAGGAE